MGGRFADALRGRFVFVVGKGGVGKTTTACSMAIQFADRGELTHLISTDPAHSLSDVMAQDFGGKIATAGCADLLRVEPFDAASYAAHWLENARAALAQIVERGTYLDAADAGSLLDLTLPGVDEVMSAQRLVELDEGAAHRIVVDTAPTGHTLRLLDAAEVTDSWADALSAMIEKADAVAIGLLGQSPGWPAIQLLEDWRARGQRFRALLRSADFVVVTRAGSVVAAETERLLSALEQRELHVAAVVGAAGPAEPADWFAPELTDRPRGCDALRNWSAQLRPMQSPARTIRPARSARSARPDALAAADWLAGLPQRLLLVAGKGGVGKSTCAAALALLRSESTATCLVSTDPAGSLQDVLDCTVTSEPAEIAANLRVWQLNADQEYTRLRSEYSEQVRAVFERLGLDRSVRLDQQVIERLWNLAPPGIDEIVALTQLMRAAASCTTTVLDSAPTGHFLRLVSMPETAVEWSHALMRILLKYHIAGALEQFTREVLDFARGTRELHEKLTNASYSATVLVTLDQPVVWAETVRLHKALQDAKIPVAALVINQAAADPNRGRPDFANTRIILAPHLDTGPVGPAALREFLANWELARCPT